MMVPDRKTVRGALGLRAFVLILAAAATARAQESWDAVYIQGHKVGYINTRVQPVKYRGQDLLRVQYDQVLTVKRGDDDLRIKVRWGTIETLTGKVLRLDTRTLIGEEETRTHGDVNKGKMVLERVGGGQSQRQTFEWGPEVRGPYAVELTLSREPMKPGETRKVKAFIPELSFVWVTIKARGYEDIELGGGSRQRLLRVDTDAKLLSGKSVDEMNTTYWVDTSGQALKTYTDVFGGLVTYRTTREAALSEPDSAAKLDLLAASIIKIPRPIDNAENTRDIVYRISLAKDDPAKIFPSDGRQVVRPDGNRKSITLEVRSVGPGDGPPGPASVPEEYLRANTLITSTHPQVVAAAEQATAGKSDAWSKAVAIEDWVAKNLPNKNFKVAFAPANEVIRTRTGDCTEHSVLTTAMCRAVGIPARAAVGLVYADRHRGFGPHMWTEVYINRRWVSLDAAFNQSQVDATHIKLADTSLDGVLPFEVFLPVTRVFGSAAAMELLQVR